MVHPENPRSSMVLNHLKDLPKSGTLSQATDGMIYLDIADDWIFKSLEVLTTFGYKRPEFFVHPPAPVGSHIKVITRREAEDYELGGGHSVPDIPEIGQEFEFEVVSAYPSYPRKRSYGVESRYKLKIECPELERIRRDLTGLAKPTSGFFICVGVRFKNSEYEIDVPNEEKLINMENEDDEIFDVDNVLPLSMKNDLNDPRTDEMKPKSEGSENESNDSGEKEPKAKGSEKFRKAKKSNDAQEKEMKPKAEEIKERLRRLLLVVCCAVLWLSMMKMRYELVFTFLT